MKYVFYFCGMFAIIYEMKGLIYPNEHIDEVKKTKKSLKKDEPLPAGQIGLVWSTLFYLAWLVIGLFTFQWWAFLVLILMGIIPKKWVWYVVIDSAISIGIVLFIILNAFHFHIKLL